MTRRRARPGGTSGSDMRTPHPSFLCRQWHHPSRLGDNYTEDTILKIQRRPTLRRRAYVCAFPGTLSDPSLAAPPCRPVSADLATRRGQDRVSREVMMIDFTTATPSH
eukprot:78833-Chlamydomonas_euryale.AAC.1